MPAASAYVDTSVLGAYYCPEALSTAAERTLRAIATPVISTLTEVELTSLIARKRRLGELTARQALDVLELFQTHVDEGYYRRLTLGAEHYLRARELIGSLTTALHTLDALHLAVALGEDLPLLTADRDLARAARRYHARALPLR
jgi:predicted nucleic acid-binding protein